MNSYDMTYSIRSWIWTLVRLAAFFSRLSLSSKLRCRYFGGIYLYLLSHLFEPAIPNITAVLQESLAARFMRSWLPTTSVHDNNRYTNIHSTNLAYRTHHAMSWLSR